jgi:hypothetical protein
MNQNQIFKSSYHLIAALLLLFIIFNESKLHIIIKILLAIVTFCHLYDVWWFYNNDGNAPI